MARYCACGCGTPLKGKNSRWAPGHWKRGTRGVKKFAEVSLPHEMGTTGTSISSGIIQADVNTEFNDYTTRLDRFEKMEKTDSACHALFLAISLPLRSVNWWVEPASDSTLDKKIADSITWNLTQGMTVGFDALLQEILTCVSRGFSVFEKVFEPTDAEDFAGTMKWRKLAFRSQRTIDQWDVDETGGVVRVHQQFSMGERPVNVWIPIEKLLIFTYQKEGSDYTGQSLFRPCWRDYYYKDALQRIEAIGLERFWIGIPHIQLPKGATTDDKDTAFDIVTKLRGDEAAGVVMPETWQMDILRVAAEGGGMNDVIARYTRNIFLTGLAHFLSLGDKNIGSWALSKDQSAFFLFGLNSIADNVVADTFNKHAIPQLVRMNWPNITKFPTLKHDALDQTDVTSYATNLKTFVESGFLSAPDANVEEELRKMLELPKLEDRSEQDQQAPPEQSKQKEKPSKLAESPSLITEKDIALAVIDFTERSGVKILDAEFLR